MQQQISYEIHVPLAITIDLFMSDEQLDDRELHASRLRAYLAVRVLGIQGFTLDIDFVDV